MKYTKLKVRLLAAVMSALSLGTVAAPGQGFQEPLELSLMPGAGAQFLFAQHAAATNERQAFGLKGPVRAIDLRFESEAEAKPGEMRKQPGRARFEFDADGNLVRAVRDGDPDNEAMTATRVLVMKEIAGVPRVVERKPAEGNATGLLQTERLDYDEKGALVKLAIRNADGGELVRSIVRKEPGGPVTEVNFSGDGPSVRREYDETGRLVRVFVGPSADQLKKMQILTWDGAGRVHSESSTGDLLFDGAVDVDGGFTAYSLRYGGNTMECVRVSERDKHGNWTVLTTTMANKPQEGKPLRLILMRWTRAIEYDEDKPTDLTP